MQPSWSAPIDTECSLHSLHKWHPTPVCRHLHPASKTHIKIFSVEYRARDARIRAHQPWVFGVLPYGRDKYVDPAIKARFFGEGTPYRREEWDRLLGDCQAIADMPHILFAEELIAAYPEAKVVLTNRSPESWWKSYHATVWEIQRPTLRQRLNVWLDPQFLEGQQELARLGRLATYKTEHLTEDIAKAGFLAHDEELRRLTPMDKLLEFELREGWTPLCNYLGKETPAMDFPRVNDTAQFHETISAGRRAALWRLAPKLAGNLLATVVAVILLCFGRMRTV
ncbi:hypothetical protein B0H11DRAFT_1713713 [Mycena galericulata]|nr:hypothetical protein B0H11DRAFT_1713713 [Mycena galericulata]